MDGLPKDVISDIFTFISLEEDFLCIPLVCRKWNNLVVTSPTLWTVAWQQYVGTVPAGKDRATFMQWLRDTNGRYVKFHRNMVEAVARLNAVTQWTCGSQAFLPSHFSTSKQNARDWLAVHSINIPDSLIALYQLVDGENPHLPWHGIFGEYTFGNHTVQLEMLSLDLALQLNANLSTHAQWSSDVFFFGCCRRTWKLLGVECAPDGNGRVITTSARDPTSWFIVANSLAEYLHQWSLGVQNGDFTMSRRGISQFPSRGCAVTSSVTKGVQVEMSPLFIAENSNRAQGRYFFAYRCRMRLLSSTTFPSCQLIFCYWAVENDNGDEVEYTRGDEAIGQFPLLYPCTPEEDAQSIAECPKTFEYCSCTTFHQPVGALRGSFQMVLGSFETPAGEELRVLIHPFHMVYEEPLLK